MKNDRARKAWLAGLQDGETVAIADDKGVLLDVFGVTRRATADHFWVSCFGSFTLKTGRGTARRGVLWIIPATEYMKAERAKRKAADQMRGRFQSVDRINGWRAFTDEQIASAAAILWPDAKP